jgi:Spy/CpxP family protein refolding chaperone
MKLNSILIALALGASTCLLQAQPDNQPPGEGGQRPGRRQGGGPGGPGGMQGGGFHIIPPMAQEQLNLTDDQKKQIESLEKETKAKLDSILTDEQKTKLKDMQEKMRRRFGGGQGGQGGPGGPGGGRPPGGQQRPPADDK